MKQEKPKKFFNLEEWKSYWRDGGEKLYKKIYSFDAKASALAITVLAVGLFIVPQLKIPALIFSAIIGLIAPLIYTISEYKKYKQEQILQQIDPNIRNFPCQK
ncbi:MAG: hypothetical protein PHS16_00310 [Candidatus Colwellbacteria bacterium]|jgi:hypothetical protein|nr:hypothetical protein [Candidatus Colwellbacteria bacterium]MCK9497241.1 hypothetical protein [Candidatus Colwellbacteria bacterium]MDD3752382.1 hypothetical protein [Candidatus Colwellbacteria bacterium]MDD4818653.1 hypothetical protein [Candidatus Colwellbacteria bacterium]